MYEAVAENGAFRHVGIFYWEDGNLTASATATFTNGGSGFYYSDGGFGGSSPGIIYVSGGKISLQNGATLDNGVDDANRFEFHTHGIIHADPHAFLLAFQGVFQYAAAIAASAAVLMWSSRFTTTPS